MSGTMALPGGGRRVLYSSEETTAARCLSLIERHADKFRKTSGGGLTQEARPRFRPTLAQRAHIISEQARGITRLQIAEQMGCSPAAVTKVLDEAGVPRGRVLTPIERERRAAALALYKAGKNTREVAEALRFSNSRAVALRQIFIESGELTKREDAA